jgi:hypothetical protein
MTRIAIVGIARIIVVTSATVVLRADTAKICMRIAAIYLCLPVAAHLVEFKLLLLFQVLASLGFLTIVLPAFGQFIILALVQAVYLIVEIAS